MLVLIKQFVNDQNTAPKFMSFEFSMQNEQNINYKVKTEDAVNTVRFKYNVIQWSTSTSSELSLIPFS